MLGDMGPEVFYDVQKTVLRTLEDKYYSSFLTSECYQELKNSLTTDDVITTIGPFADIPDETNCNANDANEASVDLNNHSTYARNKLEQLQVSHPCAPWKIFRKTFGTNFRFHFAGEIGQQKPSIGRAEIVTETRIKTTGHTGQGSRLAEDGKTSTGSASDTNRSVGRTFGSMAGNRSKC